MIEKKITLKSPVRDIAELTMREPKVIDMIKVGNKAGIEADVQMFSILTGQPPSVLHEMSVPDYQQCVDVYQTFINAPQENS